LFYIYIDFLVNNLIEEEIKNGIPPERIVSKTISEDIYHVVFNVLFQIVGGFSM
jgi:hypothetical protein